MEWLVEAENYVTGKVLRATALWVGHVGERIAIIGTGMIEFERTIEKLYGNM